MGSETKKGTKINSIENSTATGSDTTGTEEENEDKNVGESKTGDKNAKTENKPKLQIKIQSELPILDKKAEKGKKLKKIKIQSAEDFEKISKIPSAVEAYFGKSKDKKPKVKPGPKKIVKDEAKQKRVEKAASAPLNPDESIPFYLLSFLNLAISGVNGTIVYILIKRHLKYRTYLSILEGYDDSGFEFQVFYVMFSTAVISGMGFLVTNGKLFGSGKGMLRYMIYIYIGWMAALIIVVSGTLGICYFLTFVSHNLFQGYTQSMMKFSTSLSMQRKIHKMHKVLKCCGYLNYTEWLQMTWSDKISKMDLGVPISCCLPGLGDQCIHMVTKQDVDKLTAKKNGCKSKLVAIFNKFLWTVVYFMGGSLIALILCMIVAMLSVKIIRNIDAQITEQKAHEMALKMQEQREEEERKAKKKAAEAQKKKLEEFNKAKAEADKARAERIEALRIKFEQEKIQKAQQAEAAKQKDAVQAQEKALGLAPPAALPPAAAPPLQNIISGLEAIPGLKSLPGASNVLGALTKLQ